MVVKLLKYGLERVNWFESSVISYGSETRRDAGQLHRKFESSVISYGSETATSCGISDRSFESSVISYGSET